MKTRGKSGRSYLSQERFKLSERGMVDDEIQKLKSNVGVELMAGKKQNLEKEQGAETS